MSITKLMEMIGPPANPTKVGVLTNGHMLPPGQYNVEGRMTPNGHIVVSIRQAAKAMNFGSPPIYHKTYDGLTAAACFERFERYQREGVRTVYDKPLTQSQLEAAREMWSARLREQRREQAERDAARATSVRITLDPEDL